MSNIAEGFERDGHPEFNHFLGIVKGYCTLYQSTHATTRTRNLER